MSCDSLIPPEVAAFKVKAEAFAAELEGDLLDSISAIDAGLTAFETELNAALAKIPEVPDLQTEMNKLLDQISAATSLDALAADLDSDIGVGVAAVDSGLATLGTGIDGKVKELEQKFGLTGLSVSEIANGNFDPCSLLPVKEDGSTKAAPPEKPEKPPEQPKVKEKQEPPVKKVESGMTLDEKTSMRLFGRAFTSVQSALTKAVLRTKKERIAAGENPPDVDRELTVKLKWNNKNGVESFIKAIGLDIKPVELPVFNKYPMTTPEEDLWLSENFENYLSENNGKFWEIVGTQYTKLNEENKKFFSPKLTEKTVEDGAKAFYETKIKPLMEKNNG